MPSKWLVLALSLTVIIAGPLSPVATAKRVPIQVDVLFEVADLTTAWGSAQTQKIQTDASRLLAKHLKEIYRHWDFRTDEPNAPIKLQFKVVSIVANKVDIRLDAYFRSHFDDSWQSDWLKPGDGVAGRYPHANNAAERLHRAVDHLFMNTHRDSVRRWLQESVPLAKDGIWLHVNDPTKMLIVLSLSYEEYQYLDESIFHITGKLPSGPRETLEARGIGISNPFPPDGSSQNFHGLVAVANRHRVTDRFSTIESGMVGHLRNLKLGPIYLREEIRDSDQDIALFEEDIR